MNKKKSKRGLHLNLILYDFTKEKTTLAELFPEPLPASRMQKKLWKYVKKHKLRIK